MSSRVHYRSGWLPLSRLPSSHT